MSHDPLTMLFGDMDPSGVPDLSRFGLGFRVGLGFRGLKV